MTGSPTTHTRRRVPAAERRDALVDAAIHHFAQGGYHGTPVDRIAREVGVAQPYVFSLFGSKRDLFLAAVERGFARTGAAMRAAAETYDPAEAPPGVDVLKAMGLAYEALLRDDRDLLMLQLHAYAACDDPVIRDRVRAAFARLTAGILEIVGDLAADTERIDDFVRYGMWCNVAAAMGVGDLSVGAEWMREETAAQPSSTA